MKGILHVIEYGHQNLGHGKMHGIVRGKVDTSNIRTFWESSQSDMLGMVQQQAIFTTTILQHLAYYDEFT